MKRLLVLLLILPALAFSQSRFGHGGGGSGLTASQMMATIADSSKWTAGSTTNRIKPRDGKSLEADSIKAAYLNVTGNTQLDGNMTMNTIATEQVKLGTGSDAAPELSSAGDTDTGIRWPGGNKMRFVQDGINSHTFRPYLYSQLYSDGDTLGISLNGTYAQLYTSANLWLSSAGTGYISIGTNAEVAWTANNFYPSANKGNTLGSSIKLWKDLWLADNAYIGGKDQIATMYISGENTIAGSDSSWTMSAASGVSTLEAKFALPAASYSNGGRRTYFGADTLALFNGARTGRDSTWATLVNGNVLNSGMVTIKRAVSLADVAEYKPQIPSGMCGWGTVDIGNHQEWARFFFQTDGTVTLEANSTNVGTTNDTDNKLNIYDAGAAGIVIENQLGSTLTAAFVIECHLP